MNLYPKFGFKCGWLAAWLVLAVTTAAWAQRPYIGYTYPAGGQQGTTTQIRLGGQGLDDVDTVLVSGAGVTARVVEYYRRLNNQEVQLLREQLAELKKNPAAAAAPAMMMGAPMMADTMMMSGAMMAADSAAASGAVEQTPRTLKEKIEKRVREWVQTPACAAISSLAMVEVTIAPEAAPGPREIRLVTPRGISNPLPFHVGQLPEHCRKPMTTATIQTLGKEAMALRKRPAEEVEARITLPCTLNGQIASGEVNRYRFTARQGQRLVVTTLARQLVPFIADAVPGWFQPVLALYDAQGREVAFDDDYRFMPDPVLLVEVPRDGEYVLAIQDSIFRGREDFVYRLTVGELPFVTSVFPLGGRVGESLAFDVDGWNLPEEEPLAVSPTESAGRKLLLARSQAYVANPVPIVLENYPEDLDREPNNTIAGAQTVPLPCVLNGRIDRPGDWDVYAFAGRAGQTVVAEVKARRLDSPLDSVLKLTDATGRLLAFNDDREDLAAGANTHHADSSLLARLPADGVYYVHIGDTARQGGLEYGYRLRLSEPRPDFDLRVVPSSASLRANTTTTVTVFAARKDGYTGPIKLLLEDPPPGFTAAPVMIPADQNSARFTIKATPAASRRPVSLNIIGQVRLGQEEIVRSAVPSEDKMQAFLWRHLVPASDFKVLVFDGTGQATSKRIARVRASGSPSSTPPTVAPVAPGSSPAAPAVTPPKPKFTKQQIAGRLRQLKLLYEEGLLTDDFYDAKVAECETP